MSSQPGDATIRLTSAPEVKVEMVIRQPVARVFAAFIDPEMTTRFWFTRSSGRLEPGTTVRWDWEMYGASAEVKVIDVRAESLILIEWDDPPTRVEWTFVDRADQSTLIRIVNTGFSGSGDEMVAKAMDSTGGFSYLLAAAKAYLEHGIELNLVTDHAPDAHLPEWTATRPR